MTNANIDNMRNELALYVKGAKARYEDAQAKFIAAVQTNPAHAITWSAEDMVRAQTLYEVWMRIEHEIAEHDPLEVVQANLDDARFRVRSFFGSNSTSIFSNAVERARAETFVRIAEDLDKLAKRHGG